MLVPKVSNAMQWILLAMSQDLVENRDNLLHAVDYYHYYHLILRHAVIHVPSLLVVLVLITQKH